MVCAAAPCILPEAARGEGDGCRLATARRPECRSGGRRGSDVQALRRRFDHLDLDAYVAQQGSPRRDLQRGPMPGQQRARGIVGDHQTAVDDQGLAGDERRFGAGEEGDGRGDLIRRAHAPQQ